MRLPATQVYIHHSVTTVTSDPHRNMRAVEAVGLQRYGHFSYSYCVDPNDGMVLEGAGLRRGAHTAKRNSTSFGICWLGDYNERAPKVQQFDATRRLIDLLTRQGHLVPGADILGHRDVMATACPGNKLYNMLGVVRIPWKGAPPMPEDENVHQAQAPVVALEVTPSGQGYYVLTADGAVFAFGDAVYHGRVVTPKQ